MAGEAHAQMKLLKSMLAASAYIAADLAAELAYIFDFGGTMRLPTPGSHARSRATSDDAQTANADEPSDDTLAPLAAEMLHASGGRTPSPTTPAPQMGNREFYCMGV